MVLLTASKMTITTMFFLERNHELSVSQFEIDY